MIQVVTRDTGGDRGYREDTEGDKGYIGYRQGIQWVTGIQGVTGDTGGDRGYRG